MDALTEIGGTTLEHSPYSPDLAPCDFWSFPTMKRELRFQSLLFHCPPEVGGKCSERSNKVSPRTLQTTLVYNFVIFSKLFMSIWKPSQFHNFLLFLMPPAMVFYHFGPPPPPWLRRRYEYAYTFFMGTPNDRDLHFAAGDRMVIK
jgi:hypothetical protein